MLVIVAAVLFSCGGGSTPVALVEPIAALAAGFDELPALPAGGEYNPAKMTAAVTVAQDGNEARENSANVTFDGTLAKFDPQAGEVAWAIFEFSGSPVDDINSVEYYVSNRDLDGLVWLAISDYAHDTWRYFGHRNADHAEFVPDGTDGDYASPNGYTYLMVLAWDSVYFELERVQLTYGNRYPVTGRIVDLAGGGLADVLVTTSIGGTNAMTDADGYYTLPWIPDGTWHVMAYKPSYIYFNNPQEVTVAGGPLTGVDFIGERNESHFEYLEDEEPNDFWWEAPNQSLTAPVWEYLSVSDDQTDCYRFAFSAPGQYWIKFDGELTILFPYLELMTKEGKLFATSSFVRNGVVYVGFNVAATRVVIVRVSCRGGGGWYELTTGTGELHWLSGVVNAGLDHLERAPIECDADGELTYLCSNPNDASFSNQFAPPVLTVVTPDALGEEHVNYIPASINADLSAGDQTGLTFDGSYMFALDVYEPNDSKPTAFHFASLPIATTSAYFFSGDEDWFRFTPAAGKHLIVTLEVDYQQDEWNNSPASFVLEDGAGDDLGYACTTNKGLEIRTDSPCDGSECYINIHAQKDRGYSYQLTIEEIDGYQLDVGVLWDGLGILEARVDVYNFEYDWMYTYMTDETGKTAIPFSFKDGEELYVELFRYGLSCDRYTRHLTIDGADKQYWFVCDPEASADSWEPNGFEGKVVDYPFEADATISSLTDREDKYIFTPLTTDPIRVQVSTANHVERFSLSLYNQSSASEICYRTWAGDLDMLLPSDGTVAHQLVIRNSENMETPYHIRISETPGYMFSGTIMDNMSSPVPYAYVCCPEANFRWNSGSPWDTDTVFALGPFAPGTYEVFVWAANHDPAPGSPYTLTVTDADVTEDFVLTPNPTDIGEPDNDPTMAMAIASGVPSAANIDGDADPEDWRKFTAGPGLVNLSITYPSWAGSLGLLLYNTDGSTILQSSYLSYTGYQRIDYYLPVAGTFYIRVDNSSGANEYLLTANY
ncbi:carboxypeptidase regulatory-like domain-containing protein [bacterium]|nr:carboxypeptidase regulatory-like domain-containing protein [bacterium]